MICLYSLTVRSFGEHNPEPISFLLQSTDGKNHTGPLEAIDEKWCVQLGGRNPYQETGDNILTLRQAGMPRPPFPEGEQVIFANGDRIPGRILKLTGDRLRLKATFDLDQELVVPLSAIAVIWVTSPDPERAPAVFMRQLKTGKRRKDTIYLRNGDMLEGLLNGFEAHAQLNLLIGKKEVQVDFNKVAAIALNTDLLRTVRPPEIVGRLVLANGCRLALTRPRAGVAAVTGRTLFGTEVTIPLGMIIALDIEQGGVSFLSDLKPKHFETTPFFGFRWNYVLDGSVLKNNYPAGGDLQSQGNTYDRGIGMHSPGRLTFDIGGQYRWFQTLVALDEIHGKLGTVRIRIDVDGKPAELGFGKELSWQDGAARVRLSVEKVKELSLVVEPGRFGDVQGHVNWLEARLIK